ncbi:MAG TPA: hypothetical protein VFU01_15065 [Gemmatimonadaceae bacterium]|nr:hypothetical protein [Gemmatimonadaceae bacterium]
MSLNHPHPPRRTTMRNLTALRDLVVPIAGLVFFIMLLSLVA